MVQLMHEKNDAEIRHRKVAHVVTTLGKWVGGYYYTSVRNLREKRQERR